MTVTNEQIQALKAKAVDRIIAEVKAKHSHYDAYAPVMTWGEFCTIVTERDADKALIAEYDDALCKLLPGVQYMDPPDGGSVTPLEQVSRMVTDYRQQIAEQAKRIAELEARTFTVKLPDYRDTYKENFAYEIEHHVRIELEKLARAAGITLKVGGEDAQS